MRTSTAKTSDILRGHRGFSLIEILVALLLVSLVFISFPTNEDSRRHQDLQQAMEDVDRAVRFAANEAILRNSVVRLRLDLDKDPVSYVVEYGPPGDMVLPAALNEDKASLADKEKEKKQVTALDQQFTKVEEFADVTREFSPEVIVPAVATSWQKRLQKIGMASVFFYPTGERDGALVFFATQDELAILEVEPFQDRTRSHFRPFPRTEGGNVADTPGLLDTEVEKFYREWHKQ
jgi:prepilin-type N-terminal cleavage/methylation domain-containing protein